MTRQSQLGGQEGLSQNPELQYVFMIFCILVTMCWRFLCKLFYSEFSAYSAFVFPGSCC